MKEYGDKEEGFGVSVMGDEWQKAISHQPLGNGFDTNGLAFYNFTILHIIL